MKIRTGEKILRGELFSLIKMSKQRGSCSWDGEEYRIGNTPQQGINWIGKPPLVHAVIVKVARERYSLDGWANGERTEFRYALKASRGIVNRDVLANRVLLEQQKYGYPVLVLQPAGAFWRSAGWFDVVASHERHVLLRVRDLDHNRP